MNFTTKSVKTKTFSEYLQSCRTHLGLSVADVGKFAKIQPKYLAALEEGRFADLPSQVYVKGFLKSLAVVYRLDEHKLMNQFLEEYNVAETVEITLAPEKPQFSFPRFVLSPKTLTIAGLALIGLASLGYLYFQVSSLSRPPFLSISQPEADGTVSSSLLVVEGKTEVGATVFLNGQIINVSADGNFRENLSLAPGVNKIMIKSINKFDKEMTVTRQVMLAEKEIAGSFTGAAIATSSLTAEEQPEVKLVIKVGPEASWIHLTADGAEEYSGTMLPGSSRTVNAQEKVMLTTGNAGSVSVRVNDKDYGVLGKAGETLRDLEFTK